MCPNRSLTPDRLWGVGCWGACSRLAGTAPLPRAPTAPHPGVSPLWKGAAGEDGCLLCTIARSPQASCRHVTCGTMGSLPFISATTRALGTGLPLLGGPGSTVQTAGRGAAGQEAHAKAGTGLLFCLPRKDAVFAHRGEAVALCRNCWVSSVLLGLSGQSRASVVFQRTGVTRRQCGQPGSGQLSLLSLSPGHC